MHSFDVSTLMCSNGSSTIPGLIQSVLSHDISKFLTSYWPYPRWISLLFQLWITLPPTYIYAHTFHNFQAMLPWNIFSITPLRGRFLTTSISVKVEANEAKMSMDIIIVILLGPIEVNAAPYIFTCKNKIMHTFLRNTEFCLILSYGTLIAQA